MRLRRTAACHFPQQPGVCWLSVSCRCPAAQRIDLTQVLITNPQAGFLRARDHSTIHAGIFDNDILVVDQAVKPRH